MLSVNISGRIVAITEKSIQSKTAESGEAKMVAIRIAGNYSMREGGEWVKKTVWCEAVAYDQIAERWLKNFKEGDIVETVAQPDFNLYISSKNEPQLTMRLRSLDGYGSPTLTWAPRPSSDRDESDGEPATIRATRANGTNASKPVF